MTGEEILQLGDEFKRLMHEMTRVRAEYDALLKKMQALQRLVFVDAEMGRVHAERDELQRLVFVDRPRTMLKDFLES